ncbi:MAG: hypothetical protein AAF609_24665 [Cyanobacteria bacterium P01_C01_bin.120]
MSQINVQAGLHCVSSIGAGAIAPTYTGTILVAIGSHIPSGKAVSAAGAFQYAVSIYLCYLICE